MPHQKLIKILNPDFCHHDHKWVMGRNDLPEGQPFNPDISSGGFYVCEPRYFFEWMHMFKSSSYVAYADIPTDAQFVVLGNKVKASAVVLYEPLIPLHDFIPTAIEAGADVHSGCEFAIRYAAEYGYLDMVRYLVDHGADINHGLEIASENGHLHVVRYLLDRGADVGSSENFALERAAENGHVEVVECLLEHGANVHSDSDCPLRWSSLRGHVQVVKCLLKHGADVHAREDWALRYALSKGHEEVVRCLLKHGARIPGHEETMSNNERRLLMRGALLRAFDVTD